MAPPGPGVGPAAVEGSSPSPEAAEAGEDAGAASGAGLVVGLVEIVPGVIVIVGMDCGGRGPGSADSPPASPPLEESLVATYTLPSAAATIAETSFSGAVRSTRLVFLAGSIATTSPLSSLPA